MAGESAFIIRPRTRAFQMAGNRENHSYKWQQSNSMRWGRGGLCMEIQLGDLAPSLAIIQTRFGSLLEQLTGHQRQRTEARGRATHLKGRRAPQTQAGCKATL